MYKCLDTSSVLKNTIYSIIVNSKHGGDVAAASLSLSLKLHAVRKEGGTVAGRLLTGTECWAADMTSGGASLLT